MRSSVLAMSLLVERIQGWWAVGEEEGEGGEGDSGMRGDAYNP